LQAAIAHFYSNSTYAKRLPMDVTEREARQIFAAPTTGAR
jgi:hypothetical protein